ncbi:hypothetical protein [Mycobacterium sp. ENV421]|uniref:hypothetical protein n=1 Tax=Mycobacterium sp. ENV421 TaxID=1213407 RepID=UPI001304A399|nr:hypothetical protein [Mycobacterium sp. ENV421]
MGSRVEGARLGRMGKAGCSLGVVDVAVGLVVVSVSVSVSASVAVCVGAAV